MANFQAVFSADGIGIMLMCMLLVAMCRRFRTFVVYERFYVALALLIIIACLVDIYAFSFDGSTFPGARQVLLVLNCLDYLFGQAFALLWVSYVDLRLYDGDMRHMKRCLRRACWPALIIMVLSIASLFVPIMFDINAANRYERTPLSYLSFVSVFGYMLYAIVKKHYLKHRSAQAVSLPVELSVISLVVGGIAQMLFYGISLGWASMAVTLVFLYMYIQTELGLVDDLSGVYSRSCLNSYLRMTKRVAGKGEHYVGLMLDIDDFKLVNDEHGHAVGDDAIRRVGQILHSVEGTDGFSARYAGDEFILLERSCNPAEAERLTRALRVAAQEASESDNVPYTLGFSIGTAFFDVQNESVDSFMKRMDDALYADKAARKHMR